VRGYRPTHAEQVFDAYLGLPEELMARQVSESLAEILVVLVKARR
jgi:hypothetical protein